MGKRAKSIAHRVEGRGHRAKGRGQNEKEFGSRNDRNAEVGMRKWELFDFRFLSSDFGMNKEPCSNILSPLTSYEPSGNDECRMMIDE